MSETKENGGCEFQGQCEQDKDGPRADYCPLEKVVFDQTAMIKRLVEGLEEISRMPCIAQLLGETSDEDDVCGCASCIAKPLVVAAEKLLGVPYYSHRNNHRKFNCTGGQR